MTEDNFGEYRRLLLDWHEGELKFRDEVNAKLTSLHNDMTEVKTQRKILGVVTSFFVPGLVALIVTGLAKLLNW